VLPFENLTGEAEREYLSDGLTEETIAALGRIDPEHVSVFGRTSMMMYKRASRSLSEIGRELGADYLVESSIRAETGQLRITANLVRVKDQVQVWSASYDREPTSILGLQRELSTAIAQQIRRRLSPDRLDALARRQTRNAEAYDLYLRGRNFANQRTAPTTRKAIEYYGLATAVDPDYALAWSGLAFAHSSSSINGDAPPREVGARAREAAAHAVRVAPDLAEAQLSLGYVNWILDWNWPAAEAAFRRAIGLDPTSAVAHLLLGHALSQSGRHGEAHAATRRARELDPLEPMTHALSSQVAFQGRDYPGALDHARQAIVLDPEFWIGYMMLGQAYERLGEGDLALEALTNAARFSGRNSKVLSLRAYIHAKARANEAREVLRTLDAVSRERYVPPYALALVSAGLGEHDAVFEWLDRAYHDRDVHLIFLTVDPKWDPYRTDPRFEDLLQRCGFKGAAPATS
jgi:TolB-like protein/Flp pilus assembly protein TadD